MARSVLLVSALALLVGCEKELILDGERFGTRAALDASVPVEGEAAPVDSSRDFENQAAPIALPGATAAADWTHAASNNRHLMPNAALSAAPARIWSSAIGAGNSRKYRISAAPVVAQGRIYTLDATGTVAATSTAGAKLWAADLTPETTRGAESGGGLAFGDGLLFVTTGYAELVAINPASGAVVWRQDLEAPASGAPTVENGLVYVSARDGTAWAIHAKDGRVAWQFSATPSASGFMGGAGPAVSDNSVLFAFNSNEVVSVVKKDGLPLWRTSVAGKRLGRAYAGISDISGDPVVVGRTTYVGNQSGYSAAINTDTGARIWTAKEASYGPMLPVGGSVFLVSDQAQLVRLDAATGDKIWAVDMPYYTKSREKSRAKIYAHFGPVLAGGRIVVASGDGALRLFNPVDGSLVGTVDLPGGAASAPALAGGVLYVVSANGQLHAFR